MNEKGDADARAREDLAARERIRYLHGPDGSRHPNESVFLELDRPSKLVIRHVSPPRFVLTVTLAAHEAGTAITWAQEFEDSAGAARIRHIVEPANEQNLDRLRSVLAGG